MSTGKWDPNNVEGKAVSDLRPPRPTYYVKHPDGTYTEAEPAAQPAAQPVAPACRFCGGTGKVTTYTSAAMPHGTSRCPMCAGDGVCRTPEGCRDHGCHGGCLPAADDAAPAPVAQEALLKMRHQELSFVIERARDLLRCTRPRHALDDLHRDLMQWAQNRRDNADVAAECAALARKEAGNG